MHIAYAKYLIKKLFIPHILLLLSLLIGVNVTIYGQLNYPFQFYQYYQNPSLFNPAFSGLFAPLEVNAGNCSYVSYLKAQYNYCNGSYRFSYKKGNPKPGNALGFRITGYKEGKYISGSRFYIVYSYHAKINDKLGVAGGIDMGVIIYAIKGTPSTGQFSDYLFDTNAGVLFYGEKFHIGFSANQLTNNKFQPIEEVIDLKRYYNISASKLFSIHENFKVTAIARYCFPYYKRSLTDCSLKALLYKYYYISLNYRLKETGSFGVGLQKIKFGNNFLNMGVTYNTPIRSKSINVSTIEIAINYFRYKKQQNVGYFFNL